MPATKPLSAAAREAAEWEMRLAMAADETTWKDACDRYESNRMADRAKGTLANWKATRRTVERHVDPLMLDEITTAAVDDIVVKLRATGQSPATTASHLRYLRAFCRWCKKRKYLVELPEFELPEGANEKRSRDITLEEFERILDAIPKVLPTDAPAWERLVWGLWESGLRLGELLALQWESGAVTVEKNGGFWGFRFHKQKNKKDQWIPMTRTFHDRFVAPAKGGKGYLFQMPHRKNDQMTAKRASRAISEFGEKAGVRTGKGKFASAHDFRRAFATRHAHLGQWQLASLMRHESPATTQQFYLGDQAKSVAAALWNQT